MRGVPSLMCLVLVSTQDESVHAEDLTAREE